MKDWLNSFGASVTISEGVNWAVFLAALFILGVITLIAAVPRGLPDLGQFQWQTQGYCEVPFANAQPSHPPFVVRVIANFQGRSMCEELSKQSALSEHFSSIRATWSLKGQQLARAIAERQIHLLVRREDAGSSRRFLRQLYRSLAFYPAYDVYLIARDKRPVLDVAYLAPRRIGLLANNNSRSGYIVPMREFHSAGIDTATLTLVRYPSHSALREALHNDAVDVVSSYWNDSLANRFPDWQTLRIGDVTHGVQWFIDAALYERSDVRCAVIGTLKKLAGQSTASYFADLRIMKDAGKPCRAE